MTAVAVALRVLRGLRRDPRTLVLLFAVPPLLLALFHEVFVDQSATFDRIGGPLVGVFPLITMFVVGSVSVLRERVSGTLERLMTLPLTKLDVLAGYGLAFAAVAAVQALIASGVAFGLLGLHVAGPVWIVILLAIANAVLGMALGLFTSAFARSEFQAVQFLPAFVFPQLILCGLLLPRERMARWLQWISDALPMTYAYDALERTATRGETGSEVWIDAAVVVGAAAVALTLGALTLRRRTP